jgi:WD40 repeat protein
MEAEWGACVLTLEGHRNGVASVAFSPSGTVVVSGSGDNTVKIWDARSDACLNTLEGHHNKDTSIALSPSSAHIASGSYDKNIKIWDASGMLAVAPAS